MTPPPTTTTRARSGNRGGVTAPLYDDTRPPLRQARRPAHAASAETSASAGRPYRGLLRLGMLLQRHVRAEGGSQSMEMPPLPWPANTDDLDRWAKLVAQHPLWDRVRPD